MRQAGDINPNFMSLRGGSARLTCRRDEVSARGHPTYGKVCPTRGSTHASTQTRTWTAKPPPDGEAEVPGGQGRPRGQEDAAAAQAQGSWGSAALSRCSARRADVLWMFLKTHMTRGGRGGEPPGQAHRWSNSCRGRPG